MDNLYPSLSDITSPGYFQGFSALGAIRKIFSVHSAKIDSSQLKFINIAGTKRAISNNTNHIYE